MENQNTPPRRPNSPERKTQNLAPIPAQVQNNIASASQSIIGEIEPSTGPAIKLVDPTRKNNKKWIMLSIVAAVILVIFVLVAAFVFFKPTKYSPALTDAKEIVEFTKQSPTPQAGLSSYTVDTGDISYRSLFFDDAKVIDMRKWADSPVSIMRPGEYLVNTDTLHVAKSVSSDSMSCLDSTKPNVKTFDLGTSSGSTKACAMTTQNDKIIYQRALEYKNSQYTAIIIAASDSKNDQEKMRKILESIEIF